MKNIAIVVSGFNRVKSLTRILNSLLNADYLNYEVPLIISIDYSGSEEVSALAERFNWPFGKKTVISHSERLGLRNHILFCGNLSKDYDAIVMLEDDIYVSPHFFSYVIQTVEKYDTDERIAGISLYGLHWNQSCNRPFIPDFNGYDVYFAQYAQSWGQIWTKRMWNEFYTWYKNNSNEIDRNENLPENILNWPSSSWLKYFMLYILKSNKYFVYPYHSLSTNFSDPGTHNSVSKTSFQVPLLWQNYQNYRLPNFSENQLCYDIYLETNKIYEQLDIEKNNLCVDLYGIKKNREGKQYWLTTETANYKIVRSFGLKLRPHELNVIANIEGNEIFLYDTSIAEEFPYKKNMKLFNVNKYKLIRYDIGNISIKSLLLLLANDTKRMINLLFNKASRFMKNNKM